MSSPLQALLSRQFVVFICGGLMTAAIDIGVMQGLMRRGLSPVTSASAGFFCGLVANYLFHARMTFTTDASLGSLWRYLAIVAVNYLITVAIVWLADILFALPLVGKIASLPAVAINGYLLSKHWAFR